MSVPVTIFSANEYTLLASVNNGDLFSLPGSGPDYNWVPQQPNPNPLSFTNGNPAPNVFGTLAANQVLLIFQRGPLWPALQINIPQNQTIDSLQLYIFFEIPTMVSWMMLNSGQPIAWGTYSSDAASETANKVEPGGSSERPNAGGVLDQ